MKDQDLRRAFLKRLAVYLVEKQALRSIALECGDPHAKEWAELRGLSPIFGYPTVAEAEKILVNWFELDNEKS